MVRLLLDKGADPKQRADDDLGNTPLHYAAFAGKQEIVELLTASGGDPNARNAMNLTASDVYARIGQTSGPGTRPPDAP